MHDNKLYAMNSNRYEVVISEDNSYIKIKSSMTIYDTGIKSAYVIKPDWSFAVVDISGIYDVVPFKGQSVTKNSAVNSKKSLLMKWF